MILGLMAIITGFFVSFDFFTGWEPRLEKVRSYIVNYAKYVGIVAMIIGVWKFFGPDVAKIHDGYQQATGGFEEPQPFIGDLLPALFTFIAGSLLAPQILHAINISDETRDKISDNMNKYKIVIGLGCMAFGLIHLFIPGTSVF